MTKLPFLCLISITPLVACTTNPNDVLVKLSPDVVSSLDGTVAVHATLLADREPSPDQAVSLTIEYTDRNGVAHAIPPVDGKTDKRGSFDATLIGLTWDGTGKVTATTGGFTGEATFAVLDRTPPKVTIMPPANNQISRNNGVTVQVHVTDEIGVSQVFFDTSTDTQSRGRSLIASGTTDTMVGFDLQVQGNAAVGSTIMLYALAADLSGNQGAATPVTLTVTP